MAALLHRRGVGVLADAGLQLPTRQLEHEALVERTQVVEHALEPARVGLGDRDVLVDPVFVSLVFPFRLEHAAQDFHPLGKSLAHQILALVHDDVEDEELILDLGTLRVEEFGVEHIPLGTEGLEELEVRVLGGPRPVVLVFPSLLEDDLFAVGENRRARPVLFLLGPVPQLLHQGDGHGGDGLPAWTGRVQVTVGIVRGAHD